MFSDWMKQSGWRGVEARIASGRDSVVVMVKLFRTSEHGFAGEPGLNRARDPCTRLGVFGPSDKHARSEERGRFRCPPPLLSALTFMQRLMQRDFARQAANQLPCAKCREVLL